MGGTINAKRDYQQTNPLKITQSVTPVTTIAAVIFVLEYEDARSVWVNLRATRAMFKRRVSSSDRSASEGFL